MGKTILAVLALLALLIVVIPVATQLAYDTTGKLLCAVGNAEYRLALEIKGAVVYPCTEIKEGLFRRKRFRKQEWPIGSRVRVLVDESSDTIYMRDREGTRKEIVLRCKKRVSSEEWSGCGALSHATQ